MNPAVRSLRDLNPRLQALPLWGPVASVLLAFCWLIPNSSPLWVGFHKDLWAGAVLGIVGATLAVRGWHARRPFPLDAVSGLLVLLAALPLLQWAAGRHGSAGHALVGTGYFLAAACAACAARAWEREQSRAVAAFLFPAFLLGALVTAALILRQWLNVGGGELFLHPGGGSRPFGNMLQPNNAATLLLLGQVAIAWHARRGTLRLALAAPAGLVLMAGLVLTQSRIGYLGFVLLAAAGAWAAPRLLPRGWRTLLLLQLAAFALLVAALPTLSRWVGEEVTLLQRSQGEMRMLVWRGFLAAAWENPWWGMGFLPGVRPHLAAAAAGHPFPALFTWSHNAVLDIAVWFGFPAAAALVGVGLLVTRHLWRRRGDGDTLLHAAALFPVTLHAMVELPLGYAYFLLPYAMLLGAVAERVELPAWRIPARAVAAAVAGLLALLVLLARDYLEVERSYTAWQMQVARIGRNHPPDLPQTLLLHHYRAVMAGVRYPAGALDDAMLRDFEQGVLLSPSTLALQRLVATHLLRGDEKLARHWMEVAMTLAPAYRSQMAQSWESLAQRDPRLARLHWPG